MNLVLDPYQFAYEQSCGTDDAINTIVHLIVKHLENTKAYARQSFIDFTSTFNTIQPHFLLSQFKEIGINLIP